MTARKSCLTHPIKVAFHSTPIFDRILVDRLDCGTELLRPSSFGAEDSFYMSRIIIPLIVLDPPAPSMQSHVPQLLHSPFTERA